MSVLIKGMKMPRNCWDCFAECFFNVGVTFFGGHCPFGERQVTIEEFNVRTGIHPSCPFTEVPPHGRLVDADALKATFCAECNRTIKCEDCDIDYHIGRLAPTIIEAEEGEEDDEHTD